MTVFRVRSLEEGIRRVERYRNPPAWMSIVKYVSVGFLLITATAWYPWKRIIRAWDSGSEART